ncbi:hypothetical protein P20439_2926 [Pseudoalteromonas sp. BSi20439]|jgi:hypothetical protein|nr:hypothetical protein P20439_2926 [Pseudoalteromonas sp. BSi20439]
MGRFFSFTPKRKIYSLIALSVSSDTISLLGVFFLPQRTSDFQFD